LSEFGLDALPRPSSETKISADIPPLLYRLSDASGTVVFEPIDPPALTSLTSSDAFLLDHSSPTLPAIYVWIGQSASLTERRLAVQYAQIYAYKKQAERSECITASISLVKMNEGYESEAFLEALSA
jgi:gelsolin